MGGRIPLPGDGMRKLVLFDIDGTLVDCGPQVGRSLRGRPGRGLRHRGGVDAYDFTGRTDPGIVLDLMTGAGVPGGGGAGGCRGCGSSIPGGWSGAARPRGDAAAARGGGDPRPAQRPGGRRARPADRQLGAGGEGQALALRPQRLLPVRRLRLRRHRPLGSAAGGPRAGRAGDGAPVPPGGDADRGGQPARRLLRPRPRHPLPRRGDRPHAGRDPAAAGADWVVPDLPAAAQVLALFADTDADTA